MYIPDVTIFINAFREDAEDHAVCFEWLMHSLEHGFVVGVSEYILSSFVRICTHPKVFVKPNSLKECFAFTDALLAYPKVVSVVPNSDHWGVFKKLCERADARGNLVPDAYIGALALEKDAELVSMDRDFMRFPGLKYLNPVDMKAAAL